MNPFEKDWKETPRAEPLPIETWAIVELMGHVKMAGRLSEEERFGCKLGRIDIPDGDTFITKFFGGASVYRVTLVTEEVARHVGRSVTALPVSPWDFPKRLENLPEPKTELMIDSCGVPKKYCANCGDETGECCCEEPDF